MAQIFSRRANRLPAYLLLGGGLGGILAVLGIWYFFSPEFTDVGYQPSQPIAFSHRLHAGELEIDCRYCHTAVETADVAGVPSTAVCMNCHRLVGQELASLEPLRQSLLEDARIEWVRVHKVPEYAYFTHRAHIRAGVGCSSCHGDVASMDIIRQVEPLSMSWCLECHRNPAPNIRPADHITSTEWTEEVSPAVLETLNPPTDCTACHR